MTTQSRPIKSQGTQESSSGSSASGAAAAAEAEAGTVGQTVYAVKLMIRALPRLRTTAQKLSNLQRLRKTIKIYDHFVFKINLERKRGKDQPQPQRTTAAEREREKGRARTAERERESRRDR